MTGMYLCPIIQEIQSTQKTQIKACIFCKSECVLTADMQCGMSSKTNYAFYRIEWVNFDLNINF